MEDLVARIPGAAFAVDEDLRIIGWNRGAEERLGISASATLGRPCYETVPAVDEATGHPCHEECPLLHGDSRSGWAHNRLLKAHCSDGRQARLDCFILRCLLPTSRKASICFLGLPTAARVAAHSRLLEAVESIYPVVSDAPDFARAMKVFLGSARRATLADAAELFVLDPEAGQVVPLGCDGQPAEFLQRFRQSAMGDRALELITSSRVPLVTSGPWPLRGVTANGWYVCIPLVAEGATLGAIGIASRLPDFDVGLAVRTLFPLAVQVGIYLRWAYQAEGSGQRAAAAAPGAGPRLRVYLLGSFRLLLDGQPVPLDRFQRVKKAITLLSFLAVHRGKPVSREALMELLWPGVGPARAAGNLRVVLHTLRHNLEPDLKSGQVSSFVLGQGDLVYLDPSDRVWVDVEEFVKGARRAATLSTSGRYREALAEYRKVASLYRGQLLEDEPYADWSFFEREHLSEVHLDVLRRMASILAQQGELEEAIDVCRSALRLDQGREEVHRLLMRLLWQSGRRDEALRQYQACRRVLLDEFGVEPSAESQSLYRAMVQS